MENKTPAPAEKKRGHRKVRTGTVISDKMDKTVVVRMERLKIHSKYKKFVRSWKKIKAHDEENACHEGDQVEIVETRPLSKQKRWRVKRIIKKAD